MLLTGGIVATPAGRRARRLAAVLAGLVAAAALGELICRADLALKRRQALAGRDPGKLATTAIDDGRRYGMRPDPRHHINSNGFRDLERQPMRSAGSYRIAVIGDSVSVQPELPFEQLWVRQLQRRLDRRLGAGRVELVNFAVTGYGTSQQLVLLRQVVLGFHPNALLWQFHLNDAMDPFFDGPDGALGVYYTRPTSALLLDLDKLWTRLRRSLAVRRQGLGDLPMELRVQVGEWRRMTAAFESVREVARAGGVEVFVFVLPTWPSGTSWDDEPAGAREVYSRLVDRFAGLGLATLDLAPAFERLDPESTRAAPSDPWHPGPAGHRLIADEVARWLEPRLREKLKVES